MNKLIFTIATICSVFSVIGSVSAQESYPVFSSSLGGGGAAYVGTRRTMYTPRTGTQAPVPQKAAPVCKSTAVRYQPDQTYLTEEEKEKYLGPIIQRSREKKIKSLEIIGYAHQYTTVFNRLNPILKMFDKYGIPYSRPKLITGVGVLKSNDNVVEFRECR